MPDRARQCTIQARGWEILTFIRLIGSVRRSATALTSTTRPEPMPDREIWIGLAQLCQQPGAGVLMDRNLAYANVLALASDHTDFTRVVRDAAAELGFDLLELEECEPLRCRLRAPQAASALVCLSEEVLRTGAVRFGTLYTWVSEYHDGARRANIQE
jgi:hypothetical protein